MIVAREQSRNHQKQKIQSTTQKWEAPIRLYMDDFSIGFIKYATTDFLTGLTNSIWV